jgi:hypothetical protein
MAEIDHIVPLHNRVLLLPHYKKKQESHRKKLSSPDYWYNNYKLEIKTDKWNSPSKTTANSSIQKKANQSKN